MKFKVHQRINKCTDLPYADHVPNGWYMVVAVYPTLEIITVKSEFNGKEYNVIV